MKVLLAVDGSPCSDEAIEEVACRPRPQGSEIEVLTAFELPLPPSPEAWGGPPTYFEELDFGRGSAPSQARGSFGRIFCFNAERLGKWRRF